MAGDATLAEPFTGPVALGCCITPSPCLSFLPEKWHNNTHLESHALGENELNCSVWPITGLQPMIIILLFSQCFLAEVMLDNKRSIEHFLFLGHCVHSQSSRSESTYTKFKKQAKRTDMSHQESLVVWGGGVTVQVCGCILIGQILSGCVCVCVHACVCTHMITNP